MWDDNEHSVHWTSSCMMFNHNTCVVTQIARDVRQHAKLALALQVWLTARKAARQMQPSSLQFFVLLHLRSDGKHYPRVSLNKVYNVLAGAA
jgi:hypothetical protein